MITKILMLSFTSTDMLSNIISFQDGEVETLVPWVKDLEIIGPLLIVLLVQTVWTTILNGFSSGTDIIIVGAEES